MKNLNPFNSPSFARSLVMLFAIAAIPALAATNTWTGGSGSTGFWTDAANWGGTAPSANDRLFFDDGSGLITNPTNDYAAGTIFNHIEFNASTTAFTLYGNAIILTNGAEAAAAGPSGGSIINNSPNAQVINMPITLAAGHHAINTVGGGSVTIPGVSRNANAGVQFTGSGAINLAGSSLGVFNGILGGWALIGNDWATFDGSSNVVAYASYTDMASGAIGNIPASNIRYINDSGNLTSANGTTVNSILSQVTGANRTHTVTGVLRLGAKGGIYHNSASSVTFTVTGGNITTAGSGGELTFSSKPGTTSGGLSVNSVITNDIGGALVSVNVQGYTTMNAANTYSGGTFIFNNGRLNGNNAASAGTGPVTVYAGGQYFFGGGVVVANSFSIAGIGTTETSGGQTMGAIRLPTSTAGLTGTITLRDNARISGGSGANNTISGKITGPGRLEFTAATGNNSSIVLNNLANDWSGGLLITAASGRQVYLKLGGADNQIPDGAGKGDVAFGGVDVGRLDLNGRNDTINGLISAAGANYQVANFGTNASTLTLGNNNATATFGGVFQDGGLPTNSLSIVKIGTGTQTFTGANTYRGNTTVNGGVLVFSSANSFPTAAPAPVVTVNSNATLDVSAIGQVTLGAAATVGMSNGTVIIALQASGNTITTSNLTAIGATNYVTLTQIPAISSYPAQFVAIKYTTLNGALNFGLCGPLPASPGTPYNGYISNNVANNSVDFVVTAGPTSIKWSGYSGGNTNSAWDVGTPNWVTGGGAPTTYVDGVFARFDDSASNGVVTLSQTVSPAGVTVSNSALAYTISDPNAGYYITGSGGLLKHGAGTLILDNSGANDFGGGVSIAGGTLQIGNNDAFGNVPASATVVNSGTLTFNRTDPITVPNLINGPGAVNQIGSGTVTLGGANGFTGTATVSLGTLKPGVNGALGATNGPTVVTNGGTLDIAVNAINIGQEPVTISGAGVGGNGALINSSGSTTFVGPNLARLTLAADSTVGGSGRLDLRAATTSNPNLASLNTGGLPRKLTKVGANQFTIVGVTVDSGLGDVEVQAGTLGIEAATTSIGNTTSNLFVRPGATLEFFDLTNRLNKVIWLNGDGVANTISGASGATTIIGPVNLTNDCLINLVNKAGVSLTLSNVLTGTGIIHRKTGTNTLVLAGNSPDFAGGAIIEIGTLNVSGMLSNNLGIYLTSAGNLTLTGTIVGAGLTNDSGTAIVASGTNAGIADIFGDLLPGATGVPGTFTSGRLIIEPSANLTHDLNTTTTPGGGINDLIVVNGDLTFNGGTININTLGLLKTGASNPYRLFNYTGTLFNNTAPSIPSVGGYNFTLDTSIVGQVNIVVSGGPPVWNGGSATDSNWTSSDNWGGVALANNNPLFFFGPNRLNNTNDTSVDNTYGPITFVPAAGAFTLNGNPIQISGGITNFSANPQTIDLGLDFGTGFIVNGLSNSIILGGGLTNTAAATTTTTLTLAGTGIITNLLASIDPAATNAIIMNSTGANWTLMDNPSSTPITVPLVLEINNGTFNFGTASSAPKFSSTTIRGQPQDMVVGAVTNTTSTINFSNGVFNSVVRLNTGTAAGATGVVNQVAGTVTIADQFQGANGAANATSFVNLSGGTMNIGPATNQTGTFFVASRGPGSLNVGGTATLNCGILDVSRSINSSIPGVVNLNSGGTITVTRVGTASANSGGTTTGSSATFNFNGGTLVARTTPATWFQGNLASPAVPITTIVKSGGAIIDSGTNLISILEPMLHDSTLGASHDGGLIKLGSGALALTAANSYTGPSTISNGTLVVNGSLSTGAVTVQNGGTLAGAGSVGGTATVNAGGSIAPGSVGTIGTLTVSGNIALNGTTIIEVNKTAGTKDLLTTLGSITYNGTLSVSNLAGSYAATDTYKIFNAGSYFGSFTSITPAIPATGFAWNTNTLPTDGTLRLVATVNTARTNITIVPSGNQVTLSWPADHIGWRLQAQTNTVSAGLLNNWFDVPNTAATNQIIMPVNPANGAVFYRMIYP